MKIVNRAPAHVRMRFKSGRIAIALTVSVLFAGVQAWASSCTTQALLQPADRDAIVAAGNSIADAIATQKAELLQGQLLPSVVADWEGIRNVAQNAGPLVKGGELHWRTAYLLDATDLKAVQDAQFFCTNSDNTLTVTVNLRNLPPGKYTLMVADYTGAALAGQLALILGADSTAGGKWKLGGIFAREGAIEGHDGIWFWTHARELAGKKATWSSWFDYDAARSLLLPVDFLSTPNLEKLNREQAQLGPNPAESLPLTVTGSPNGAEKSWKITALHLDTTLHTVDLGLVYEGAGLTDPVAARAEAVTVMGGLLKLHPELRDNFHGLWAYAERDGKQSYAIELAMRDIP